MINYGKIIKIQLYEDKDLSNNLENMRVRRLADTSDSIQYN